MVIGAIALDVPVGALIGNCLKALLSSSIFIGSVIYWRRRFGKLGGEIAPGYEETEKSGDSIFAGAAFLLTVTLPTTQKYVVVLGLTLYVLGFVLIRRRH